MDKTTFKKLRSEYRRLVSKGLHKQNNRAERFCSQFEYLCGVESGNDKMAFCDTGDSYGYTWAWALVKRSPRGVSGTFIVHRNVDVLFRA
jgi:hypothetical protein